MTQKSNRAIIPRPCMKVKGQQIRRGGGEGLCAVQVAAWTCDRMQDGGRGEEGGGYGRSSSSGGGGCYRALNPGQEILREALPVKSPVIRLLTALYLGIREREEGGRWARWETWRVKHQQLLLHRPVLTHKCSCSQVSSTTNSRKRCLT